MIEVSVRIRVSLRSGFETVTVWSMTMHAFGVRISVRGRFCHVEGSGNGITCRIFACRQAMP